MVEEVFIKAKEKGLFDFFILSTCNRTEFYACASMDVIKVLVTEQLNLKPGNFESYFYVRTGVEAVRHLFRVSAGLDSQIIGDYEIVGQLKMAIQLSREHGLIGTLTDRISSLALQASKAVKVTTNLSSGKYSVSFAAAELLAEQYSTMSAVKILIVGIGKFGRTLARNLKEYFPCSELTLSNRTPEHSEELADELQTLVLPFEDFTDQLSAYDVVITAAQADQYLIRPEHLTGLSSITFLDLGIPHLIDPQVKFVAGAKLYSVDDVSTYHNNLIKQRHLEIPKAEIILDDFIQRLIQWQNVFFRRDIIRAYKERMQQLLPSRQSQTNKIDKVFSGLIQKIRTNGYQGCQVIETMNEVMEFEK